MFPVRTGRTWRALDYYYLYTSSWRRKYLKSKTIELPPGHTLLVFLVSTVLTSSARALPLRDAPRRKRSVALFVALCSVYLPFLRHQDSDWLQPDYLQMKRVTIRWHPWYDKPCSIFSRATKQFLVEVSGTNKALLVVEIRATVYEYTPDTNKALDYIDSSTVEPNDTHS